jgi:uncharacterized membrane protein
VRRILCSDRLRPTFRAGRFLVAGALSAVTLAGLLGCDDDDDVTAPFTPSIDITIASGTVSLEQGASATVNVTLARRGGFTGPIALEVTGAPAGLTASFDPAPVSAGTSSTLTLAADASTVPGTYDLTVTASGTGVASRSATLTLTITLLPPSPSIGIVLGPAALSVVQGQSGSVTVDVSRGGGYAGDVALAVSGAPPGVTTTVNPPSVVGAATSTLTVNASVATAPGSYSLTVTGSGTGVASASATLALTVTAAPSTGFIGVDVNAANNVLWVVQGESKNWEVIVTRGGGFTGAVDLSIEGLPPNVTATLSPVTLAPGMAGSLLTLTAQSAATVGTTNVTIRARGAGVADATVVVQLSVRSPGP